MTFASVRWKFLQISVNLLHFRTICTDYTDYTESLFICIRLIRMIRTVCLVSFEHGVSRNYTEKELLTMVDNGWRNIKHVKDRAIGVKEDIETGGLQSGNSKACIKTSKIGYKEAEYLESWKICCTFASAFGLKFDRSPKGVLTNGLVVCGNSSVGRARPCQGRGREFESRLPLSLQKSRTNVLLSFSKESATARLPSRKRTCKRCFSESGGNRALYVAQRHPEARFAERTSPGGGIGRRVRFRCVCREACRFESCSGHSPRRWWNWYTRYFEGVVVARSCEFESHPAHTCFTEKNRKRFFSFFCVDFYESGSICLQSRKMCTVRKKSNENGRRTVLWR